MEIKYGVVGKQRKAMVTAIASIVGAMQFIKASQPAIMKLITSRLTGLGRLFFVRWHTPDDEIIG